MRNEIPNKKVLSVILLGSLTNKLFNYNLGYIKSVIPLTFYYNELFINNFDALVNCYQKKDTRLWGIYLKLVKKMQNVENVDRSKGIVLGQGHYSLSDERNSGWKESFSLYLLDIIFTTTTTLMNVTFQFPQMRVLLSKEMNRKIVDSLKMYASFYDLQKKLISPGFILKIFGLTSYPRFRLCSFKENPCDLT